MSSPSSRDASNDSFSLANIISTPYPNVLLEAKLTMGETESRVVDLIVRRTLGYAGKLPGQRRAYVRLPYTEIKRHIGRSSTSAISDAIDTLVRQGFVEVCGINGEILATPAERRRQRAPLTFRIARRYVERV